MSAASPLGALAARLGARVDGASLAVFRIGMGLVIALEGWDVLRFGQVEGVFTGAHVQFRFAYPGFAWLRPPATELLEGIVALQVVAGIALVLGTRPRLAAATACAAWTYVWLLDAALWNNHFYLYSLLLFLLAWMPSDRRYRFHWFVPAARRAPDPERGQVPLWCPWLLRAQLFAMYFYAGVAKLSVEWMQHAEPMATALRRAGTQQVLASLLPGAAFEITQTAGFAHLMSRAGLVFDLGVGFLLLLPRTRILALVLATGFHGMNHAVLFADIGWFPLAGMWCSSVFLAADWPARTADIWRRRRLPLPQPGWAAFGAIALAVLAAVLALPLEAGAGFLMAGAAAAGLLLGYRDRPAPRRAGSALATPAVAALLAFVVLQLALPWRHLAIAGDVNWTAEGSRFAWRMKTYAKAPGPLRFRIEDPALIGRDADGAAAPRFDVWQGPALLFEDVDVAQPRFEERGAWLVVFDPFVGERVVVLAHTNGIADPAQAAAHWRVRYGRDPEISTTRDESATLAALTAAVSDSARAEALVARVEEARSLRERMRALLPDQPLRTHLATRFRREMRALARDREVGPAVRRALESAPPLWVRGADEPAAPALIVRDPEILAPGPGGVTRIVRERWRGGPEVLALLAAEPGLQAPLLPRVFYLRGLDGDLSIQWNPEAELHPRQIVIARQLPYLIHQYAQHVAEEWQALYGRRPRVFADSWAALLPHAPQRQIYEFLDLAELPLRHFSHNDWIPPLERTQPVP